MSAGSVGRTAIVNGEDLDWSGLVRVLDAIFELVLDGNLRTRSQFLDKVACCVW